MKPAIAYAILAFGPGGFIEFGRRIASRPAPTHGDGVDGGDEGIRTLEAATNRLLP